MRTIIYPHKVRSPQTARAASDQGDAAYGRLSVGTVPSVSETGEQLKPDDYLARLAKHVPAEVLALFLLASALLESQPLGWRIAAFVFGVVAAVALDRERRTKPPEPLRVHGVVYDLFVVVAFAGWAIGTSELARGLFGLDRAQASFVTIVIAFGLARVDEPLGKRFEVKVEPSPSWQDRSSRRAGTRRQPRRRPDGESDSDGGPSG